MKKIKRHLSTVRFFVVILLVAFAYNEQLFAQETVEIEQEDFFEMSLEELVEVDFVYTASKYKQKTTEAPSSVSVVTSEEIKLYGYRTLADMLQSLQGFYNTYDRDYDYIGVRGFGRPGDYNTRILLLIDGHRVNDNISDAAGFGTEFHLDVDLIDRVEVIRGPGAALYGSNAVFAVVNVITKDGKAYGGTELVGGLGSFGTEEGQITYGDVLDEAGGVDFLVSASYLNSGGPKLYFKEFDDPSTHNGMVKNDDEFVKNFFAKLSFGEWSLVAAQVKRDKGLPTAPWGTVFGDARTRDQDDFFLLGVKYHHAFSDDFAMNARFSYNQYNWDGQYALEDPCAPPATYVNFDKWKGKWWETELQFIADWFENHKLTWGGEFRYNVCQDQKNYDSGVWLDDKRHPKNWGMYIQDEFNISDDTAFISGVRLDKYDTIGDMVSPRLALIHNFSDKSTAKLIWGKAFRAPTAYELYYHDGYDTMRPPSGLAPEKIETFEAILEHSINRNMRGGISGFYNIMEDLIDQTTDPCNLLTFTNTGRVEAAGVEVYFNGKWDNGIMARGSYSLAKTRVDETKHGLTNSPKHMLKFNISAPLIKDKLFAGFETQYQSKRKTLTSSHTDDAITANLVFRLVNVLDGLELSAGIYNIFDEDYGYPGFGEHEQDILKQDGRSLLFRLIWRF